MFNCPQFGISFKITALLVVLLISNISAFCQTKYNIKDNNGKTINLSSGIFTSSNECLSDDGQYYNYCDNEDYTITFCSSTNSNIRVLLTQIDYINQEYTYWYSLNKGDSLYIYDGPDVNSPLIGAISGFCEYSSAYSSGSCMTFRFKSNGDNVKDLGWEMKVDATPTGCNGNLPASDEFENAPVICNINAYCGTTSAFYTPDYPDDLCDGNLDPSCQTFSGGINNNSWLAFIADSTKASFNVAVSNSCKQGIQFAVYSLINNKFTLLTDIGYTTGASNYSNAGKTLNINVPYLSSQNLTKGQKYYIMVDGLSGDVCDYTIKAETGIRIPPSVGADQTICEGGSATLSATGGKAYSWFPAAGLSNVKISNPVASPTTTTKYYVTITSASVNTDCPFNGLDSVIVNVNSLPKASAGPDVNKCSYDGSVTLTASGGSTYLWNIKKNTASISVNPAVTTNYVVTVTDKNNCSAADTAVVKVITQPVVNSLPDKTINSGQPATLLPSITGTATSYKWSTGDTILKISVKPTLTCTYILTAFNNGCTATNSFKVIVMPPVAYAGEDQTICKLQPVTLTGTGGGSYSWSTGNIKDTTATIIVNPTVTTTYTLIVTKGGNTSSASVVITVALVSANAGQDVSICNGNSTELNATGNGNYSWSTKETKTNISVNPTIDTYYIVTAELSGCTATDGVWVRVNPNPVIISVTKHKCSLDKDSVTLSSKAGLTNVWNSVPFDNTLTGQTSQQTIKVSPTQTTVYTIKGTDSNGCIGTTNDTIVVTQSPTGSIVNNKSACINEDVTITFSGKTGSSATYAWKFEGANPAASGSQNPPKINWGNNTGTKQISLAVKDSGCSNTFNSSIDILNGINAYFKSDTTSGCPGMVVRFTDTTGLNNGAQYTWDFGDGGTSSVQNPSHQFIKSGKYNVCLSITSSCSSKICKDILVYSIPKAEIGVNPQQTGIFNPDVNFYNKTTGIYDSIIWYLWDNSIRTDDFKYTFTDTGTFYVKIYAYNKGCVDSAIEHVIIKPDYTIYIPNAFTPNGDGKNDIFQVGGTGITEFEMTVFNRWGAVIFESIDINNGWNGREMNTKQLVESGVYPCRIYIVDSQKKRYLYYTSVTLIYPKEKK
ncbi:MAG: gliding motility-associated C-terminal domain-containing protein [Bacteroidota bacterium]|nr:gliding motility-associated C-terminal domain-containing protein [Bacteroidota bacterium]